MLRLSLFAIVLGLQDCELNPNTDFDRHSMSWLIVPASGDTMVFEAQTNAVYPAGTPEGEATRKQWMADWLDRRGLCPNGFNIVDGPRSFRPDEDNPHRAQLRYELQCAAAVTE